MWAAEPMYISGWNRKAISTPHGPRWPVLHREKHGALVPKFPGKGEMVKPADCFAACLEEDSDGHSRWWQ